MYSMHYFSTYSSFSIKILKKKKKCIRSNRNLKSLKQRDSGACQSWLHIKILKDHPRYIRNVDLDPRNGIKRTWKAGNGCIPQKLPVISDPGNGDFDEGILSFRPRTNLFCPVSLRHNRIIGNRKNDSCQVEQSDRFTRRGQRSNIISSLAVFDPR